MLRLLMRSDEGVGAVEAMDQAFAMTGQVHTNIIAGLSLDDGETIAAWLPEAEVEIEATLQLAPNAPGSRAAFVAPQSPMAFPLRGAETLPAGIFARPDITIIERDGKRHEVQYVGLDGLTGLSLLHLAEKDARARPDTGELAVVVGQRLRLFSPEPVREAKASTSDSIYVRIGETDGEVVKVVRGASGEINRIRIKSLKLTPSNVGGIAINDAGQTVGIVESIEGGEANILSPSVIRAAAGRVLARQTSVPRPWLGVTGEPVAFASLEKILEKGWEMPRAMSLLQKQRGILLNSIAPGSPAAIAALRAGDVIVSVNDNDVKSNDDFSLLLTEAGSKPVRFSIVRPNTEDVESIVVKLSEARDPLLPVNRFVGPAGPRAWFANPLLEHGIETVPLRPASNLLTGTANGWLVVYVQPKSAAFQAGLRSGDVIEAIDGQTISAWSSSSKLVSTNANYDLSVLRGKQRLVFKIVESEK
ncbi:MAG: Outer rane stress sensor protease DegQ, serine protease [Acidobacteria bacterium]|nr:Outer rane stress sensor protease DegQ, serine protease [Acidobacteriota bacterium]